MQRDIDDFVRESQDDYIGLWQAVARSEERGRNKEEVQAETLDVVRGLLARGLLAGNLTKDGGFKAWSDQNPTEVTTRIQREWEALGQNPSVDDIAWFHLPRPA